MNDTMIYMEDIVKQSTLSAVKGELNSLNLMRKSTSAVN